MVEWTCGCLPLFLSLAENNLVALVKYVSMRYAWSEGKTYELTKILMS
jgi:hypothetical protein